jgi:hypothetical protein
VRLVDLKPRWVGAGGDGISSADGQPVPRRDGVGVSFDCPCGCDRRCFVAFTNPLDGGSPHISPGQPTWERTGDTFETLTLSPSLLRLDGCGWHGFVEKGGVRTV